MKEIEDPKAKLPSMHNWRTTDEEEVAKRRFRAQTESLRVQNLDPSFPIFSNFAVKSGSGLTYTVEVRSVSQRRFSCSCVDFRINALGTCKHVEATLLNLEARHPRLFRQAEHNGGGRIDVVPDLMAGALRVEGFEGKPPAAIEPAVGENGLIRMDDPEEAISILQGAGVPRAIAISRACISASSRFCCAAAKPTSKRSCRTGPTRSTLWRSARHKRKVMRLTRPRWHAW